MNTSEFRRLTEQAVAMVEQVEARERELAAAAELLSQEPTVQAAFRDGIVHGRREERERTLSLIESHLVQLEAVSLDSRALRALRRQVLEARQ